MEQRKRKRSRRLSGQKKLILALDGVLIVALLGAIVWLFVSLGGRGKATASAVQGGEQAVTGEQTLSGEQAAQSDAQPDGGASAATTVEQPYAEAITPAADGHPQSVDFSALTAQGVPAVAWLYAGGTVINYPVVQTLDNEYYMERNELGKRSKSGAIFLDCRNSAELADAQVMIYGNPMADGSMFGSLLSYRDQAYYTAHPTMYLYTAEKTYRIDVFSAHAASPAMSNYPVWFENDSVRATFVKEIREKSLIQTDLAVASDAKLVSLVTSSDFNAGEDARFVVHGVLTEQ